MTLYLKYRPQKIEDLDLTSVRTSLQKIIESGRLPHAFLFSGTKGTGKTSSARILAKVINCEKQNLEKLGEPCDECETCISIAKGNNIDVIEMDAASNRGIDDVRVLRENIGLSPVRSRKKVYIIDEAHMLTTEAANALLKTLEEPPAHVVFMLATTNPEKLPDTINSRLTNVQFNKATVEELMRRLKRIVEGEKITATDEGLEVIARFADGSFRDGVKVLEQLWLNVGEITRENAEEYLFQTKLLQVDTLIDLIAKKDIQSAVLEVERVAKNGGSIKLYITSLSEKLHKALLADIGIGSEKLPLSSDEIVRLLTLLGDAKQQMMTAVIPQLPIELALIKWCGGQTTTQPVVTVTRTKEVTTIKTPEIKITEEKQEEKQELKADPAPATEEPQPQVEVKDGVIDHEAWSKLLVDMKQKNSSIEALLRASKLMEFDGKTLTLGVYYQFHKERLEVGTNRKILEDVAQNIFGAPVKINCLLTEKPAHLVKKTADVLTEPADQDIIRAAKEIFS